VSGRYYAGRTGPLILTLEVPWASCIPGLHPYILVDADTGEIVGYPSSERRYPTHSMTEPTRAHRSGK